MSADQPTAHPAQIDEFQQHVVSYSGQVILLRTILFVVLCAYTVNQSHHNIWLLTLVCLLACQAGVLWMLRGSARAKLRWWWWTAIVLVATVLSLWLPIKLTSIGVTVIDPVVSTEMVLARHVPGKRLDGHKDWVTRGTGRKSAGFILKRPLDRIDYPLEIRFGKHRFDYIIQAVSFGTDLGFVAIPIVKLRGSSIAEASFIKPDIAQFKSQNKRLLLQSLGRFMPRLVIDPSHPDLHTLMTSKKNRQFRLFWWLVFLSGLLAVSGCFRLMYCVNKSS